MALAHSKLTAQGQISVPASVRKKLGVSPGSTLEWDEEDGKIVVRRSARYTNEDLHRVAFPEGPPKKAASLEDLKEGIQKYIRDRYARGRY
jgi:antitoxin PrlF